MGNGYYVKKDNMVVIYPEKAEIINKSLAKELRPNHPVKSTQKKIREIFPVDPSTVCQYTGLEDTNGVKIFEGDLVSFENSDGEKTIYCVEWIDNGWYVCCRESHYPESDPDEFDFIFAFCCVVIGNIHDSKTPITPNQKK